MGYPGIHQQEVFVNQQYIIRQKLGMNTQMENRKPTLREEVDLFHQIMNIANMAQITGDSTHIRNCILGMDSWSYAHRVGNGENTDRQQQKIVNAAFWRLKEIADDYKGNGSLKSL